MNNKKQLFAGSCLAITLLASHISADVVVIDDHIVNGSECVGVSCDDGEIFDFDTLKLKAESPSIFFQDTSVSASFPTNDWRMGMSGQVQTSDSIFYIEDADSQNKVLQLSSTPEGGVAIGAGAELVDSAVSVGAAGNEKRVANVAQGVYDTDAVNLEQFKAFEAIAQSENQSNIDTLNGELTSLQGRLDNLGSRLESIAERLDALSQ
ncbi:MAG: hypothetical protein ACR2PX_16185 [Endozoicomonas sp.]|uniref:hypothetical protein n=1 Tax=Endozoicomonas sp. TaxID=1892382 RepID=UPI003D9B783C